MSEMTERVARALKAYKTAHQDSDGGDQWWTYEDMARAAIAAMREPTEEMREAGAGPVRAFDYRFSSGRDEAEEVWAEMIDAALSERPQMKSPSQNPAHIQKRNEQDQDHNNLDHGS